MALNTDFSAATFAEVKKKIIEFLKQDSDFTDYDFAGSRMSKLIDGWAYTVVYGGAHSNAALFESFRQTARKRESVVLNAQNQGYIPASSRAATIEISTTLTYTGALPTAPTSVTVPRGFKYFGQSGSDSYEFVATNDEQISGVDGIHTGLLTIAQGNLLRNEYSWDLGRRIFIKDDTIDRRFITVSVNGVEWTNPDNAARVSSVAQVYYIRETVEGWTEIYFGAGEVETIEDQVDLSSYVGGLKPTIGDTIVVEHLETKAGDANFITDIKIVDSIVDYDIEITVPDGEQSQGGGDKETIERIRLVSPKVFEKQGRVVTPPDYETHVLENFGTTVEAVKAWTPENKTGYTFMAIKPVDALTIAPSLSSAIVTSLKKFNVAPVTPKIVSPIYVFIDHNIEVDYDVNELKITEAQLEQSVIEAMQTYYDENITTFNSSFHVSKLLKYVDNTNSAIKGSSNNIGVVKEFSIPRFFNLTSDIEMSSDGLELRSLSTKEFTFNELGGSPEGIIDTFNLHLESTDAGFMIMGPFPPSSTSFIGDLYGLDDYDSFDSESTDKWYKVGTVNYTAGTFALDDFNDISQNNFTQEQIVDDTIKFTAQISETDVYSTDGELIIFEPTLRPEYINITFNSVS